MTDGHDRLSDEDEALLRNFHDSMLDAPTDDLVFGRPLGIPEAIDFIGDTDSGDEKASIRDIIVTSVVEHLPSRYARKVLAGAVLAACSVVGIGHAYETHTTARSEAIEKSVTGASEYAADLKDSQDVESAATRLTGFTALRGLEITCPQLPSGMAEYVDALELIAKNPSTPISLDTMKTNTAIRGLSLTDIQSAQIISDFPYCEVPEGIQLADLRQFYLLDDEFREAIALYGDKALPESFETYTKQAAIDSAAEPFDGIYNFNIDSLKYLGGMTLGLAGLAAGIGLLVRAKEERPY